VLVFADLLVPGDEEDNSHTVGLGIVLDDVHYARTVQLPGPKNHSDKDPGEVLAQAVSAARFSQRYSGSLALFLSIFPDTIPPTFFTRFFLEAQVLFLQ